MAGANAYKLLLEGELLTKSIDVKIASLQKKKIILDFQLDQKGVDKFNKIIDDLKSKGNTIAKIKLFEDDKGGINKAVIEYKNEAGQIEKITRTIDSTVKATKERYVDLAKVESELAKIERDRLVLTAKQSDEMAKAAQNADKFLNKSKDYAPSAKLTEATRIAEDIKRAVGSGDIENVRKLNAQLDIAKTSFSGVAQGVKSWTAGMAQSIKTTIQYAASVGMLYAAIGQIKDGVQYIKDLNKELVNIQLVTGDTAENTAKLGLQYNTLAKEMGATTLEVTRGSLEFIRQGKSAEDTATLIRNSTMMSKLGNMEAAESSEALTSIMNGYKLSAEETGEVVSKLVSIKFVETHSNMWIEI